MLKCFAPLFAVCLSAAVTCALVGCRGNDHANVAFQHSTITALLDGNYDGEMSFAQLRRHGDFGLGTFDALDGEMVACGGAFYQVKSDGRASEVPDAALTPFAIVTQFRPS